MRALSLVAAFCATSMCVAAEVDVQRQLLQREQGQAELRLKMQQQQERASTPPQSPSADFQRRTLERDQQQRFREFQERQAREALAPPAANDVQQNIERQRAPQTTAEELKRLERERQLPVERSRVGQ